MGTRKKAKKPRLNRRTGKPYDNASSVVRDWTSRKLLKEHRTLDHMVNVVGCSGCTDVLELDMVSRELEARGFVLAGQYVKG